MKNRILACAALVSVLLNLYMSGSFIRASAPTYDEPVHIARGCFYWKAGKFLPGITDHPPVAEMIATLPLSFLNLKILSESQVDSGKLQYGWADAFLYQNKVDAEKILNTARFFSAFLWTGLLCVLLFIFTRKLEDEASAYLSLVIFSFTPVILSNNALATTDAGAEVFYLAALLFAWRFAENYKGRMKGAKPLAYIAAASVFTALAMASKFSMTILPVFVLVMWGMEFLLLKKSGPRTLLAPVLIYLAGLAAVILLIYGPGQVHLYASGVSGSARMVGAGSPSFINGRYFTNGVWWYFPFAFLVKTPITVLLFFFLGIFYSARRGRTAHIWLYAPILLYSLLAFQSRVQIGIRHILPVMPFVVAAAGIGARRALQNRFSRYPAFILLAALVFSVMRVHPYYLAYFNEAAGGPGHGYRLLADSNLDWGQDLKSLGAYLKEEGSPPVYLGYFGSARPEYYGVKYVPLGFNIYRPAGKRQDDPCFSKKRLVAISATALNGVYFRDKRLFSWAEGLTPVFTAGHSIFLYDLSGNTRLGYKLAETLYAVDRGADAACLSAAIKKEKAGAGPNQAGSLNAVTFSPDGRLAAAAGQDGVSLFSFPGLGLVKKLGGPFDDYAAAFSPDGKYLASGGLDGKVRLWRTSDRSLIKMLSGHGRSVLALAFSPDRKYLASGSADHTVRLWRMPGGEPLPYASDRGGAVSALAFSPDGSFLAAAGADSRLALLRVPGGETAGSMEADPDYPLKTAAFSPDGRYLAYAGEEQKITILERGAVKCEIKGLQGGVFSLAFAPDSSLIVSGGMNGELKIWGIPGCSLKRSLETGSDIRGAVFSPDGAHIIFTKPGGVPGEAAVH